MSDAPAAAVGPTNGGLQSAQENVAATAAARAMAQGPWTVRESGPSPWTVSDLQLGRNDWASLCVSRGLDTVPALLQWLRRQVLQRGYTQRRRGGHSSLPIVPATPGPPIDAESYFAALNAAKPRAGPFVVEGYGAWSLADLQLGPQQWKRLLSDRGVVSAPPELKKLRRKMKGRQYESKSRAGRKSSPPPSCSPQPDALRNVELSDLVPAELVDLGLDDAPASAAPAELFDLELFDLGLDDALASAAPAELFDLELDDAFAHAHDFSEMPAC